MTGWSAPVCAECGQDAMVTVDRLCRACRIGLQRRPAGRPTKPIPVDEAIRELADGNRSFIEVAAMFGVSTTTLRGRLNDAKANSDSQTATG